MVQCIREPYIVNSAGNCEGRRGSCTSTCQGKGLEIWSAMVIDSVTAKPVFVHKYIPRH